MIDAEKREKAISGLKYCLDRSKEKVHCGDCPYWQDDFESGCHIYDMIRDALALLKEQEARVMKFEELHVDADESIVCWVEFASKSAVNVTAPYKGMAHICLPFLGTEQIAFVVERNYGEKWRCWTSRPTPDQMRDTKWEGERE